MRIIKINRCLDCPYLKVKWFDFNYCNKLMKNVTDSSNSIDKYCPLEEVE